MKLKKYLEEFENHLNEVSVAGGTGTFVGRSGNFVDQQFAGGFHPEFGDIRDLLGKQVKDKIALRMWTDDTTPVAERDFIDMEYEYGFDKPQIHDNSKFINNSIQNWKHIDLDIQYDNNKSKDNSQYFINQSKENWEYIDKDYHTKMGDGDMSVSNINITYEEDEEEFLEDRNSTIYASDSFINKSTKNWKYIK